MKKLKQIAVVWLIGLCLCPAPDLLAQDSTWAPVGTEWYFELHTYLNSPNPSHNEVEVSYVQITSVGDTLIDGQSCRKLTKQRKGEAFRSCDDPDSVSFTYQENNRVYWYSESLQKFTLLYDFNATAGDSWQIEIDSCFYYMVTVDSTSETMVNGVPLKALHVSDTLFHEIGIGGKQEHTILERIGNLQYLFPAWPGDGRLPCDEFVSCHAPSIKGLRCYEDSVIGHYETGLAASCDTVYHIVSVPEIPINTDKVVQVYPVPFHGKATVHIRLPGGAAVGEAVHFTLYDLTGRVVKTLKWQGVQGDILQFELPRGNLSNGLYFYRVTVGQSIVGSGKLAVH